MTTGPATRTTVVVTISRQIAAGGAYIGQTVARRLDLKYADRTILERAAQVLDIPKDDLAPLEERGVSLWERVSYLLALGPPEGIYVPPIRPDPWDRLFELESRIIYEIAAQQDVVIVGRGGFHLLRDHPAVVRVFLHAPETWRARRLMDSHRLSDEASARSLLRHIDAQREKFFETVAGCPWRDAIHCFDLCLNTATLGLDAAADLICQVVKQRLDARDRALEASSSPGDQPRGNAG
jgi:cytidylate kinase